MLHGVIEEELDAAAREGPETIAPRFERSRRWSGRSRGHPCDGAQPSPKRIRPSVTSASPPSSAYAREALHPRRCLARAGQARVAQLECSALGLRFPGFPPEWYASASEGLRESRRCSRAPCVHPPSPINHRRSLSSITIRGVALSPWPKGERVGDLGKTPPMDGEQAKRARVLLFDESGTDGGLVALPRSSSERGRYSPHAEAAVRHRPGNRWTGPGPAGARRAIAQVDAGDAYSGRVLQTSRRCPVETGQADDCGALERPAGSAQDGLREAPLAPTTRRP
jgi:hypothetical protein